MKALYVTDQEFTDQHWQAFYHLLEKMHDRHNTTPAPESWKEFKKRKLKLLNDDKDNHCFLVFDQNTAIAHCSAIARLPETDKQTFGINFMVLDDPVPPEVSRIIAEQTYQWMTHYNAEISFCMTSYLHHSAVVKSWGDEPLNRIERFRLERDKANLETIEQWRTTIPKDNPDLKLVFWDEIPDEHAQRFVDLFSDFIRMMPTERKSDAPFHYTVEGLQWENRIRKKNGTHLYTFGLLDSDGLLIAHTNGFLGPSPQIEMYQAMTGVIPEYQGRKLSKWLKAELFVKVGQDFPLNKSIITDMRAVNIPIQTVNRQTGYELVSSGHEYSITRTILESFLKQ